MKSSITANIFISAIDTPADLFFQTCFNYINEKRARTGVQPLKWRNDLADQAQRWAQYLADTNSLKKDPKAKKHNEGETLSWSKPAKDKCEEQEDDMCYSCRQAIDTWYKNRKWHSHRQLKKIKDAYSQVRILITLKVWFSYDADGQRHIVGIHSRKKITKDFTHE